MIGELVEGALSNQDTGLLLDSMHQDPVLIAQVMDELSIAELISRELNPARSDAAFIEQLNTLIDSGFDPGDDDSDGDPGDGGDGGDSLQQFLHGHPKEHGSQDTTCRGNDESGPG